MITLPGLDPGILFRSGEKDRMVKPGEGEWWGIRLAEWAPLWISGISIERLA